MMNRVIITLLICMLAAYAFMRWELNTSCNTCAINQSLQQSRSAELAQLLQADQSDRVDWQHLSPKDMQKMLHNDLTRRKRVAEIFAEGCLTSGEDYYTAALIYQHGDVSDHYYQAYLWALRAAEKGHKSGKGMAAVAIDRYLVKTGKKQLFASQMPLEKGCYCIQPVEPSFPDSYRKEYGGMSIKDRYQLLAEINAGKSCVIRECNTKLSPSPRGTIPGLW